MSGPLAGVRVVDLTSAVLGPVATQIEALDFPELADDERFCTLDRRTETSMSSRRSIIERMRRRTTAEWRERLDRFDVPNGVVTGLEGLRADPSSPKRGSSSMSSIPPNAGC